MLEGLSTRSARSHLLRPRVLIYGTLILGLAVAFVVSLTLRNPLPGGRDRDRGVLGREVAGGMIGNVYRLQIINTSDSPRCVYGCRPTACPDWRCAPEQGESDVVDVEAAANKLVPMVIRAPAGAGQARTRSRCGYAHDQRKCGGRADEAAVYVPVIPNQGCQR
ncbi:FixG Ig-like domain-containing protein [Achromobacter xylosoxidans]